MINLERDSPGGVKRLGALLADAQLLAATRMHATVQPVHVAAAIRDIQLNDPPRLLQDPRLKINEKLARIPICDPAIAGMDTAPAADFLTDCADGQLIELPQIATRLLILLFEVEPVQQVQYGAFDTDGVRERISREVVGQDQAVGLVLDRLIMTRRKMDERPERPDGVFLFAGPTGTGKTALAQAVAKQLYGGAQMIRYDMSEFSSDHTIARLLGAPPGYTGSSDPTGWLTTKIRRNPQTVLLLDEIEKAHPTIWNTFLQVFDAGRLTDSGGNSATFSETVIIMTTNLGARVFSDQSVATPVTGLRQDQSKQVLGVLKENMSPELLNRLDEIIIFHPLPIDVVTEIAQQRIRAAVESLKTHGCDIEYGPDVVDLLVAQGFSNEYGARQLLRALERNVRVPAAKVPPGEYRAIVRDGTVQLDPI